MLPPEPPPPLTPNRFVQQISQILEPALKETSSLNPQAKNHQPGEKSENSSRGDSGDESDSDDDSTSLW